jgi:hypothetical protein
VFYIDIQKKDHFIKIYLNDFPDEARQRHFHSLSESNGITFFQLAVFLSRFDERQEFEVRKE